MCAAGQCLKDEVTGAQHSTAELWCALWRSNCAPVRRFAAIKRACGALCQELRCALQSSRPRARYYSSACQHAGLWLASWSCRVRCGLICGLSQTVVCALRASIRVVHEVQDTSWQAWAAWAPPCAAAPPCTWQRRARSGRVVQNQDYGAVAAVAPVPATGQCGPVCRLLGTCHMMPLDEASCVWCCRFCV